ncbi:MAG: hypothetical protein QF839_00325 [Candidatus Poseidoniaceae archaeon]|jgi:hypothetical protein|nr:hypothetical protein [Candidatus Poseidoniaceae archaeon]
MGWRLPWKRRSRHEDRNPPLRRDTRAWLTALREVCERHFDQPQAGRMRVRELQVEWREANTDGTLDDAGHLGLERRAYRLLNGDDEAWLMWLDDLAFWQPGWNPDEVDEQA